MKAIYWKGKIYEGVECDLPDINNFIGEFDSVHNFDEYNKYLAIFETILLSLTSIPVSGSHDFKNGQEVVKGVDYDLSYCSICGGDGCDVDIACCNNLTPNGNCCGNGIQVQIPCTACQAQGTYAIPITPKQSNP